MTNAQKLSKMSEKARNEKLVKTAKGAIKKYAPDFYKYTSGNFTIEFVEKDNTGKKIKEYYEVKYVDYNREEEFFLNDHPISVLIWANSGVAYLIFSGDGLGVEIPEKPLTRGQKIPKLEYKRKPPFKLNSGGKQKLY